MLVRGKVIAALEAKKSQFNGYQVELRDTLNHYQKALERLPSLSQAEIEDKFEEADVAWPGALPTVEQDQLRDSVVCA